MRILRSIFVSLVMIAVVAGIGALIAREAVLVWGTSHVRSELNQLKSIARSSGAYSQECQRKGAVADGYNPLISELGMRFTSSTEYVMEVVCGQIRLDPILVSSGELPPFVTKVPGTSGILWDEGYSGIILDVYGRQRAVVAVDGTTLAGDPKQADLGFGPETTCAGFGYECCQRESSIGVGDQLQGALDCPQTCFAQCQRRPVILTVATNPLINPENRTVQVQAGQEMNFSIVAEKGIGKELTTTITFGDGESYQSTDLDTFQVQHTYQCAQAVCSYPVQVTASDETGATSAESIVSSLTVRVTR